MNRIRPRSCHSPSHDPWRLRRRTLGGYRYVRLRWRILFACIDAVGEAICRLVRLAAGRRRPGPLRDEPRRILLVQFDHLGDAVITTALFKPLRQRYPGARIDVLAAPWNREVFRRVAEVDRVHVCRHNRFAGGGGLAWIAGTLVWGLRMRRRRYDLVIDVRGEFPHNVLLWLAGAPRRLGWASGGGGFLLTDTPAFVADRPELESRATLLQCLGVDCGPALRPEFRPTPEAEEVAEAAWNELGPADGKRILLHVGAGTPAKRWPAEHWRAVVERLSVTDARLALVGSSADASTARAILGTGGRSHAADWTGRFSIDQLAAVLRCADVLVGADSGPAHLAASVGTAVVVLFSGTNSIEQWRPRGSGVSTLC
ncbi:MAG: glycosyltransferase family 9 protein, partial [Thermoguttaceae bacterium]